MTTRKEHDSFEREWWGNCTNTFSEEVKQLSYAHRMGLENIGVNEGYWPLYDLKFKNVVDIGGGPVSMLLKCVNVGALSAVADPCDYPAWVEARYESAGIDLIKESGEKYKYIPSSAIEFCGDGYIDEVWIYNVLQHVDDPELIINNAKSYCKTIRIFEWIDIAPYLGHPQELKETKLNEWLGGVGTVEEMNENGHVGRAYYGVFDYA